MVILLVFIISWPGQHENARLIAEKVSRTKAKVTIVYSDTNPNFVLNAPCNLIKRPNDLFWEDKFKSCMDAAGDSGVLIIHADCSCEDWAFLVNRCEDVIIENKDIGVWAPQIEGTPFHVNVSGIIKIKDSQLVLSALTDGIIFYLSPEIINRMRQVSYGGNKFGWGIESLFCSAAHCKSKLVVIDLAVKVLHPLGKTGYDVRAAKHGWVEFLNQFSVMERIKFQLLITFFKYQRAQLLHNKRKASLNANGKP